MEEKRCRCQNHIGQNPLPTTSFYVHRSKYGDGFQSWCKACQHRRAMNPSVKAHLNTLDRLNRRKKKRSKAASKGWEKRRRSKAASKGWEKRRSNTVAPISTDKCCDKCNKTAKDGVRFYKNGRSTCIGCQMRHMSSFLGKSKTIIHHIPKTITDTVLNRTQIEQQIKEIKNRLQYLYAQLGRIIAEG